MFSLLLVFCLIRFVNPLCFIKISPYCKKRFINENLVSLFRFSDKAGYSLVDDAGIVAFRFIGEVALVNEFYCAIG